MTTDGASRTPDRGANNVANGRRGLDGGTISVRTKHEPFLVGAASYEFDYRIACARPLAPFLNLRRSLVVVSLSVSQPRRAQRGETVQSMTRKGRGRGAFPARTWANSFSNWPLLSALACSIFKS